MLIIDWVSTNYHELFNRAFFNAAGIDSYKFASFSPLLNSIADKGDTIRLNRGGRISNFIEVMKLCWEFRKKPILFLTYDSFLVPFISIFCPFLILFEHNTTPEHRLKSKHAIWQWLCFRRVIRCTQYLQQLDILKTIGQKALYGGSPINMSLPKALCPDGGFIYVAGRKLKLSEAEKLHKRFPGNRLLVRKNSLQDGERNDIPQYIELHDEAWVEQYDILNKVSAIYINFESPIRGSGWYNDSIGYNIPVIFNSPNVVDIYRSTFQGFPYIYLGADTNEQSLTEILDQLRSDKIRLLTIDHNRKFSERVRKCINLSFRGKATISS